MEICEWQGTFARRIALRTGELSANCLSTRLRNAIAKINPHIPADAQEAAIQKVLRIYSSVLLHNNEEFHKLLVEKVNAQYQQLKALRFTNPKRDGTISKVKNLCTSCRGFSFLAVLVFLRIS